MSTQNQNNRVAVRTKLTAVSSRPVNPDTRTHCFTGLDHAMALHSVHVIFYYKKKLFQHFDLDPFRVCLSEVLSLYPPVTGRIARNEDGEWEVKCNDAGVRVVKAVVGVTLDEWLGSADGAEERLLTSWDDMPRHDPSSWSPYRIQVRTCSGS